MPSSNFPERITYIYLNNAFLDQFLVFCDALCGENFFDLGPSLCWTCVCAFTASRSEKMEGLSDGGPRWQVLRVTGRQAGGGFSPLLARIWMNGDGRRC